MISIMAMNTVVNEVSEGFLPNTWDAIDRARRITGSMDDAMRQANRRARGSWSKSLSAASPNHSRKGRARRKAGSGGRGGRH